MDLMILYVNDKLLLLYCIGRHRFIIARRLLCLEAYIGQTIFLTLVTSNSWTCLYRLLAAWLDDDRLWNTVEIIYTLSSHPFVVKTTRHDFFHFPSPLVVPSKEASNTQKNDRSTFYEEKAMMMR